MTTTEWLRSKIGPSPNARPPARVAPHDAGPADFFSRYLKPDMRLLHAYCGDGRLTRGLATLVPMGDVTGVDPESANLRRARSRDYTSEAGHVSFERCSLQDLPFGPGEFDAVLIAGPLATEESPEKALEEVNRVLGPGGMVGARHTVASSRVFTAESPLVARALSRQEAVMRDLGGDPDAGLRQPGLLRAQGFVNLRITSGTEQSDTDELLAGLIAGGFVPETRDRSLEDEALVLSFVTVIETVAWKPA